MEVQQAIEFSVYLDQRPGELAGVLEAAAAGGVEITGMAVTEHLDRGLVRLLGRPEEQLRHVCESLVESGAGPVVEFEVLLVKIDQRPAAPLDIARHLAEADINVRYAYLVTDNGNKFLVLRVSDGPRGAEVIAAMD